MKTLFTFCISLIFIFSSYEGQSQFLKKMIKKTRQEINNAMEDRVIEGLAREISEAIFKPMDEQWDSLYRTQYNDSLSNGGEVDYSAFLLGMDKSHLVQESYTFDITLVSENEDHKGRKTTMKTYLSKTGEYMGIENLDEEGGTVIIDGKNNIMIMLKDEKGEKVGYAMPSMAQFAGKYVDESMDFGTPTPNGKTKTINGYACKGYDIETDKDEAEFYVAESFPISYNNSYGVMMSQFGSKKIADLNKEINGMVLQSISTEKKNNRTTKYTVQSVDESPFVIRKGDYEFRAYTDQ